MKIDYENKMIGAKGFTRLKRRYDLPSGKVFYAGDVVDLDKWPELKAAVNADVIRKIRKPAELRQAEKDEKDINI